MEWGKYYIIIYERRQSDTLGSSYHHCKYLPRGGKNKNNNVDEF
jgi:hypothetical protein